MKNSILFSLFLSIGILSSCALTAAGADELTTNVQAAVEVFQKSDTSIKKFFDTSAGYVVFPSVSKGAVGIGGAYGKGQVFEKGNLIGGEASLSQGTIGFQLGGQVYSEVIFFEKKENLEAFKKGEFAFSAQATAVAAAEGVAANAKYENGVAVFTIAKGGLMFEASVGGQKFKFTPAK
jgi:lipid-binding SYLF domain-containing protein